MTTRIKICDYGKEIQYRIEGRIADFFCSRYEWDLYEKSLSAAVVNKEISEGIGPPRREVEHAELGVDGNCGFALLGENIQEGEAEFEEVRPIGAEHIEYAQDRASRTAFNRLRARLDPSAEWLAYWIGPSHPRHC